MDAEQGRLNWRCRRGMKELDLLLTAYLRERWPGASAAERATFEQILELPDPLLAAYLTGRETPADPKLESLVAVLLECGSGKLSAAASTSAASIPGRA
jgi:antitoxin CptB